MKAGCICLEQKDMIRPEKAMGFHWYIVRNFSGNDKVGVKKGEFTSFLLLFCILSNSKSKHREK